MIKAILIKTITCKRFCRLLLGIRELSLSPVIRRIDEEDADLSGASNAELRQKKAARRMLLIHIFDIFLIYKYVICMLRHRRIKML